MMDPFGSGTTGIVAAEQNKKCILIDCNKDFKEIIKVDVIILNNMKIVNIIQFIIYIFDLQQSISIFI